MADSERQVAIVTGGSSGIGLAIAKALAAAGVSVALVARSSAALQAAAKAVQAAGSAGTRVIALPADVTDERAVAWVVEETDRQLGPVDVLVNNAGSSSALGPIWEVEPDAWWHDVTVNLRGTFLCARSVLPGMITRRRGRIINIASLFGIQNTLGIEPSPYASGYSSSKAGVLILTRHLATTTHAYGISAFAISPGWVQTALTDHMMQSEAGQRWLPEVATSYAAGRDGSPERAVQLVMYLVSGQADKLSGRCIRAQCDVSAMVRDAESIRGENRNVLQFYE
jgi:NAD(P)-dependent dehydrogenase (short-subunit alcohol dehydrogenase family)